MCLSIPSRITKIDQKNNTATVDTMGVKREVSLDLMEKDTIEVEDYVLIHIGFVMNKIDTQDALESIETFKEILAQMDKDELEKTILDGDNCSNG